MKIRRLVSLMMALILAIALAVPASAAELTYDVPGGKLYFDAATGTITRSDDTITEADIPAEINGIPVTAIGSAAFAQRYDLTRVTIPDTVTTIGRSAFYGCRSLTGIVIPDSVTSIGDWALAYNDSLTDVRLSNSLTKIPDRLFESCDSLETCTIPNGVTYLGDAFRFCSGLKSVTIPATVTAIDSGTFYGCDSLTDVYYGSDAAHWSQVEVGGLNDGLDQATIHFSGPVAGFSDVTTGDYYADAVQWAVNHGVTGGTSATTFSPAAAVTRGQAVTFLWRAAGSPEPSSSASPFTDVSSADYYYKPVLWASEQGITGGIGNNQFGPNVNLAYDQIFTMLRAAAGQSAASSDWSAAAVSWAQESGLTDGLSFSAKADCPRSDVIYCLWKQMA